MSAYSGANSSFFLSSMYTLVISISSMESVLVPASRMQNHSQVHRSSSATPGAPSRTPAFRWDFMKDALGVVTSFRSCWGISPEFSCVVEMTSYQYNACSLVWWQCVQCLVLPLSVSLFLKMWMTVFSIVFQLYQELSGPGDRYK